MACSGSHGRFLCLLRSRRRLYAHGMKQQHPTPFLAAGTSRRAPPPHRPADGVQRLVLGIGQGRLLWLDAGCELRSLSGTVLLRSAAPAPGSEALPRRLRPHAAWRSPHAAWIGIEADAVPATLELSAPADPGVALTRACGQEKSRPGHGALQRLWYGLRKLLVRRAQPAG